DFKDAIFWRVTLNTFVYTAIATLLKMVGGLAMALAMNQHFPMKNLVRALLLLPFIVPTVPSTVAWMWILDPAFSVFNWVVVALGDLYLRRLPARLCADPWRAAKRNAALCDLRLRHRHGCRPARPRRLGGTRHAAGIGAADRCADDLPAERVMVTGHGAVERVV